MFDPASRAALSTVRIHYLSFFLLRKELGGATSEIVRKDQENLSPFAKHLSGRMRQMCLNFLADNG